MGFSFFALQEKGGHIDCDGLLPVHRKLTQRCESFGESSPPLFPERCVLMATRTLERPSELVVTRRTAKERRQKDAESFEGPDRRKVERRRQIDPTTCERDYRPDEVEFMTAMDDYKRRSGRMFPTWSEVLEVIRDLGYRKVAQPTQTYEAVAT